MIFDGMFAHIYTASVSMLLDHLPGESTVLTFRAKDILWGKLVQYPYSGFKGIGTELLSTSLVIYNWRYNRLHKCELTYDYKSALILYSTYAAEYHYIIIPRVSKYISKIMSYLLHVYVFKAKYEHG